MTRNICITAVDGQTGFLIAELLLTNDDFSQKIGSVVGLSLKPHDARCKQLTKMGAKVVPHHPGKVKEMAAALKHTGADTICVIPPAHHDKFDITAELIEAAKKAEIPNVCLISSAGCDFADATKQPRLHEFLELEHLVMSTKGDPKTATGHSPVVIRVHDLTPAMRSAGFYAENLLLYAPQAQKDGVLPLPVGKNYKFAPIALGDIAQVAAHVLTGQGPQGFDDKHRGQLIVLTGPMLATGDELATAASEALQTTMKFEDISPREAKRVLQKQADNDESEQQYLLEYYSLVREGKTNYISTLAFHDITGGHPQEMTDFFKVYADEFHPQEKPLASKRRKVDGH
ncbi:MAG: hypothetical protein M1826_001298 [Phylliscum demangeonii]|nr:MAG: hypothetical protein M1826_001298 [Phylliscum demangeonii]